MRAGQRPEPPSLPDPIMTPRAADPAATRDVVCNGTTRGRRHVTAAMKAEVLAGYNMPDAESLFYEIVHWCRWRSAAPTSSRTHSLEMR